MIVLILTIIIVGVIALKIEKRINVNQMLHIWMFTTAFQTIFDYFISIKHRGYWYFTEDIVDYHEVLPHLFLVPIVNIIFLNGYPFQKSLFKRLLYTSYWLIGILIYEFITLIPEPWGYFHYGWWHVWHSVVLNPILIFILLRYYRFVCRVEEKCRIGSAK